MLRLETQILDWVTECTCDKATASKLTENLQQILNRVTESVSLKADFRSLWAIFYKSWIGSRNSRVGTHEATASKLMENLLQILYWVTECRRGG